MACARPDAHGSATRTGGSSAEQIVAAMARVSHVEGDVDEDPELRAAADIVLRVNELTREEGDIPALTSGAWMTGVPTALTVNGTPLMTVEATGDPWSGR
ncbi:hypothetical protein [Streptomyces sp. NPDC051014]|uniref:hypothetical protein n=1 Tax=Streptomyces sp. NPDC051014 TaxID=3155751 RepID=UPI00340C23DC